VTVRVWKIIEVRPNELERSSPKAGRGVDETKIRV
jgi:hypothetical protein